MFKDVLRNLRTSHEMSQEELAKKLGLGKSTISMYESGSREPSLETLEAIADTFNVDMNTLVDSKNLSTNTSFQFTAHEKQVIIAYRANPSMQDAVDRLLGVESAAEIEKRA